LIPYPKSESAGDIQSIPPDPASFWDRESISGRRPTVLFVHVFIVLMLIGVLLWMVNRYTPIDHTIKSILNSVVVITTILWLFKTIGLLDSLSKI
jgi:hypothetical protein